MKKIEEILNRYPLFYYIYVKERNMIKYENTEFSNDHLSEELINITRDLQENNIDYTVDNKLNILLSDTSS
jgi:acyl-CoA hydrolase